MGSSISTAHNKSQSTGDEKPPVLREDRLALLYWPVFGDISEVEVCEVAKDFTSERRPFEGHPMADEPATNYGLTEMIVRIDQLATDNVHSDGRGEDPELVIKRDDGGPVTIGDFVTQAHPFFNLHKETYMEIEDNMYGDRKLPEGVRVVYRECMRFDPSELDNPDSQCDFMVDFELDHETVPGFGHHKQSKIRE
ncbi:hypothetical protein CkaCkLH20_04535 [Colletotrichum karsti]|uniref:Uncharacterized protein n=1 Tax=Colletotrichum karsti TaxID=1095194 RepID=A0A9P6I8K6_9PEZI|nr:uncharacterized protein CkaCkLH20_04535 [Colletotrichum karsti]KAF9877959.1 hypothetical protein CkaCkLH20_04535 [Colletotrichum karsti]